MSNICIFPSVKEERYQANLLSKHLDDTEPDLDAETRMIIDIDDKLASMIDDVFSRINDENRDYLDTAMCESSQILNDLLTVDPHEMTPRDKEYIASKFVEWRKEIELQLRESMFLLAEAEVKKDQK